MAIAYGTAMLYNQLSVSAKWKAMDSVESCAKGKRMTAAKVMAAIRWTDNELFKALAEFLPRLIVWKITSTARLCFSPQSKAFTPAGSSMCRNIWTDTLGFNRHVKEWIRVH